MAKANVTTSVTSSTRAPKGASSKGIPDTIQELSKTEPILAGRLAGAGEYWADALGGEMLQAQDAIAAAQEGGAA